MKASLQNKIAPPAPAAPGTPPKQLNKKPVIFPGGDEKPDFKDLLLNSNRSESLKRQAQQNGNLATAKDYDSFLESLSESTRQAKLPKNKLDKNDFLNLFITQLQQQDPLKPKDGAEMASQLAQFNSLEQMMNINSALERLETKTAEGQSIHYPNYLGKEVLLRDGRLTVESGKVSQGGYEIKSAANQTVLEVRNGLGKVVAVREQGPKEAGMHHIVWDGRNTKGEAVPDGMYTFVLKGKDNNNKETEIPVSSQATITGIDLKDTENPFITSLGKTALANISQIGQKGFKKQPVVSNPEPVQSSPAQPAVRTEPPAPPLANQNDRLKGQEHPPVTGKTSPSAPSPSRPAPAPEAGRFIPEISAPFTGNFRQAPGTPASSVPDSTGPALPPGSETAK